MRSVIQRVRAARVEVDGAVVGTIDRGLAVLSSIVREDTDDDLQWTAAKIAGLRIFPSEAGAFDLDLKQVGGGVLLVSNFTVAAATKKGRRPSLIAAMNPADAEPMFARFVEYTKHQGIPVATGVFGAAMQVHIQNDGPITLILDSRGPE